MSLKIIGLNKKFGEKLIYNNFSFEFSSAGIYALVGDSGVGKTTLLRIISGLDKDYTGEIIGGGIKNVAFVFQEYRLFNNLNALDNVVIPNGERKNANIVKKSKNILLALGFSEKDLSLMPDELSGGMKQRVSLARALVSNYPILLLDEPTKELDEGIKKILYEIIRRESQSRLVLFVSHYKEDIDRLGAKKIEIKNQ